MSLHLPATTTFAAVVTRENALAGIRQSCQGNLLCYSGISEVLADSLTEPFKLLLLWKKEESIAHAQDGKGSTRIKTEILTEFLRNSQLALFANPGGR